MRKTKTIKIKVLSKGEVIDYQSVIEEVIGMKISELSCYDANWDRKTEIGGKIVSPERAYFNPDCDYEMIIKPSKK